MKIRRMIAVMVLCTSYLFGCTALPQTYQEEDRWLDRAQLNARQTPQELYQAALKEDTLVIYSITTRVMDVKRSFERQYPGLTVEVQDIRGSDLVEILRNGTHRCDVVILSDNDGSLTSELIPGGVLHKYVPWDMEDRILPEYQRDSLEFLVEVHQFFYNSEVYDEPPFENLWELTEPHFYGRVFLPNPLKSLSTYGFLNMAIQNAQEMEDAYVRRYGTASQSDNAGKLFIRRLMENGTMMTNSGDEVLDVVGTPGQKDPPVGMIISSKARLLPLGFVAKPIFELDPVIGVHCTTSVMIADQAQNINSAKLFIRWLLGEAEGQGEGYKPYLDNGAWSVRSDVDSMEPIKAQELDAWSLDAQFQYDNRDAFIEFWVSLVGQEDDSGS